MDAPRALSYIVFQVAGGVLGALALLWVLGGSESGLGATKLAPNVTPTVGLVLEAILTFFLANCVLNAAVSGKAGNLAGLAIGLTLTLSILMGGPLTGGSLNPARSIGPAVALGEFTNLWVYLAGPALGGVAAGLLYRGVLEERGHKK
jgi:glycerol uptake facilitator-like aquaporin